MKLSYINVTLVKIPLIKEFDKGYVIQAIGKFAVEENREYVSFKFF